MRIDLFTTRADFVSGAASGLTSQWRVGAIVEAIALRDALTGQLSLAIGTMKLPARIASGDAAGPEDGEKLQLRVLRSSPVLALESLDMMTGSEDAGDAVASALRLNAPRQTSPAPLLANFAWLAKNPEQAQLLPTAVAQAAARLWQALPEASELEDPETLAAAIRRSGMFLEAQLARANVPADATTTLATDFKALLLAFKQTLSQAGARAGAGSSQSSAFVPLPAIRGLLSPLSAAPANLSVTELAGAKLDTLAQQVDGALARLNTTQLLNAEANHRVPTFLVELPVERNDRPEMLRFRFAKNGQSRQDPQAGWTVETALHLGIAGALHARVSLQGSRVSVQLRAESAHVVSALEARSEHLAATLRHAGLNIDRVVCLHGLPVNDAPVHSSLLDVRA